MARINIYDRDDDTDDRDRLAGWFDPDRATTYPEGTTWNGNNNIGLCSHIQSSVGGQWLHRTAGGRWVLEHDARCWYNGPHTYQFVNADAARDWLTRADYTAEEIQAATGEALPEETGPVVGRPEIGPAFSLRFPAELLSAVDAAAVADGVSRAEWVRRAAREALRS